MNSSGVITYFVLTMSKVKILINVSPYQSKWVKFIELDRLLKLSHLNNPTAQNKNETAENKIKYNKNIYWIFIFSFVFFLSTQSTSATISTKKNNISQKVSNSQTSNFLVDHQHKTKFMRKFQFPSTTTTKKVANNSNKFAIEFDDIENIVDEGGFISDKSDITRERDKLNPFSIFFADKSQQFNTNNEIDGDEEDFKLEDFDFGDEEFLKIAKSDFTKGDYRMLIDVINSVPKNNKSTSTAFGTVQQNNKQRKIFNKICIYISVFICLAGVVGNILSLKVLLDISNFLSTFYLPKNQKNRLSIR